MTKKKVYIAGPITGVEKYWEPFDQAEHALTAAGFIALVPTHLPDGMTNADYMQINFAAISACDAVLFLPDWRSSAGAMLEFQYCTYIGKKIFDNIELLKEALA